MVGVDGDPDYLAQARFAAEVTGLEIEFRAALRLRRGAAGRALRPRPVHGRPLPPAAPAARPRPDPRARRAATCWSSSPCSAAAPRSSRSPRTTRSADRELFDEPGYPKLHFVEHRYAGDRTNWWVPNRACVEAMLRSAGFDIESHPEEEVYVCRRRSRLPGPDGPNAVYPAQGRVRMIEAVMLWNEPNNKSHWDFEIDPDWSALRRDDEARRPRRSRPRTRRCTKVLGGISPIDPTFIAEPGAARACWTGSTRSRSTASRSTGTTGRSTSGREKLQEIQAVTDLPVWVSEVGVSTFGAEEVQEFGLKRTAELLIGRAPRIHWYSLYDLPRAWPATTRHQEAEGSSYYRHFYMGLLREDGTPKLRPALFPRVRAGARHLPVVPLRGPPARRRRPLAASDLGVRHLRTGLSLGRLFRPNALKPGSTARWRPRAVRRDRHLLLHARAQGRRAALHQPAQGSAASSPTSAPQMVRRYAPG